MGFLDKLLGRGKKAAGDLTGDASMRREGAAQERAGSAEDRAALSFVSAAAVASFIAWTQWRAGIAHRRFAADAIYLQAVSPEWQRREPG